MSSTDRNNEVVIPSSDTIELMGFLDIPAAARGLVLFVHGSGSSRFSTRNRHVAHILNEANLATLLFDLFTPEEEQIDEQTRALRFNIEFLAVRLLGVTHWCQNHPQLKHLPMGYFGASTGGGAALVAAAREKKIRAVVSRGGRPDLAMSSLSAVEAPTLLIVGGNDLSVIRMNQAALEKLKCVATIEIVPEATHLFEEPGKLDIVATLAKKWFLTYLV